MNFPVTCSKKISGVYLLANSVSGESYVGCSKNILARWKSHIAGISSCNHPNKLISKSAIGTSVSDWQFSVLEECEQGSLISAERKWIKKIGPILNDKQGRPILGEPLAVRLMIRLDDEIALALIGYASLHGLAGISAAGRFCIVQQLKDAGMVK